MKQVIRLGAYGWQHTKWMSTYYPEDLPIEQGDDWRLAYYSNDFDSVLVPASYWRSDPDLDCESWLTDVNEDFRFLVECSESMFEHVSLPELGEQLQALRPQLSALVFLNENFSRVASVDQFKSLIDILKIDVYVAAGIDIFTGQKSIWQSDQPSVSSFAYLENDLKDLRLARSQIESFMNNRQNRGSAASEEIDLIISHPNLQAASLLEFNSVLQLMGY